MKAEMTEGSVSKMADFPLFYITFHYEFFLKPLLKLVPIVYNGIEIVSCDDVMSAFMQISHNKCHSGKGNIVLCSTRI